MSGVFGCNAFCGRVTRTRYGRRQCRGALALFPGSPSAPRALPELAKYRLYVEGERGVVQVVLHLWVNLLLPLLRHLQSQDVSEIALDFPLSVKRRKEARSSGDKAKHG